MGEMEDIWDKYLNKKHYYHDHGKLTRVTQLFTAGNIKFVIRSCVLDYKTEGDAIDRLAEVLYEYMDVVFGKEKPRTMVAY